jgi:iron(III) transport system ATP-binding protein
MDAALREQLARDVRDVLRREGMTAILVTHDQLEVFAMADRIGVLADGLLRQWDSALGLYQTPADAFVDGFIGQGVLLPGRALPGRQVMTELGRAPTLRAHELALGAAVEVLIRPNDLVHDPDAPCLAKVLDRSFRGSHDLCRLRLPSGSSALSHVPSSESYAPGDEIRVRLADRELHVFPSRGGDA